MTSATRTVTAFFMAPPPSSLLAIVTGGRADYSRSLTEGGPARYRGGVGVGRARARRGEASDRGGQTMIRLNRRAALLLALPLQRGDGPRRVRVGVVGEMVQPGNRRLMDCFGQRSIAMGVQPSKRIGICPRGQEGCGADRASAESRRQDLHLLHLPPRYALASLAPHQPRPTRAML